MTDAIRVLADELRRLDPADEQVAGVEAPRDVAVRERPLHVGRRLDDRPHVRVQDECQTLGGHEVGERAQVRAGPLEAVVVERHGGGPILVLDRRGDEDVRAGGGELRGCAAGALGLELRIVDDHGDEAADEAQPVAVELGAGRGAVERQPALRAQLGGLQAERCHLGQHALGRELKPPAGDLADAPRDRRARQAHWLVGDLGLTHCSLSSKALRALQPATLTIVAL